MINNGDLPARYTTRYTIATGDDHDTRPPQDVQFNDDSVTDGLRAERVDETEEALAGEPRRSWLRWTILSVIAFLIVSIVTSVGAVAWIIRDLPYSEVLASGASPVIILRDAAGNEMVPQGDVRRPAVRAEEIPDHLKAAVISIEDRRFYRHHGVDPLGIARAAYQNWRAGHIEQGGSTITQQLVRTLHLDNSRTLRRKVREAALAVWFEANNDKEDILTRYLNAVYFGAGAYGIAAAASVYFDKPVSELTLEESAMLAGLINAPSALNPMVNPDGARDRAAMVLGAMVESGAIDRADSDSARGRLASLTPVSTGQKTTSWFVNHAYEEAKKLALVSGSDTDAVEVRTTLDPQLQEVAEAAVNQALDEQGERVNASEAALVALRPDGAVLAMVGGRDYRDSQFNRATQALRQPGSTFKLFVYYAALRQGYDLNDYVEDAPLDIDGWDPDNYNGRHYGYVTLREGFVRSLNSATARLGQQVGIDAVIAAARELGIDAELPEVPSLALGTSEVSLLDLTGAYASVRAGVAPIEPWVVSGIRTGDDSNYFVPGRPTETGTPLGSARAELIALLRGVVTSGTGRRAAISGEFVAGKTGTSAEYRDAWFIGFTEDLVVGVWVGNDDNAPMARVTGGSLPATIFNRFVSAASPLVRDGGDGVQLASLDHAATPDVPAFDPQAGWCDIDACAAAYRSFRESDCTYQPYEGPRRRCTRGNSIDPRDLLVQENDGTGFDWRQWTSERRAQGQAPAICDVDACASRYRSFRAADCTYLSHDGGRRLCREGDFGREPMGNGEVRVYSGNQVRVYRVSPSTDWRRSRYGADEGRGSRSRTLSRRERRSSNTDLMPR